MGYYTDLEILPEMLLNRAMKNDLITLEKKRGKNSLSHEVYNEILGRIINNRLVPGELINRRAIAKELGVSVSPVTEAMIELEIEGFIESKPRRGSFVKLVRQEDIYGQLMVREAVECQAARLYCGKPVLENIGVLLSYADEIDKTKFENIERWQLEIQIHHELLKTAKCDALVQVFLRSFHLGVFYQINHMLVSQGLVPNFDNHHTLVQNLSKANADEAEKLIRKHLRSGRGSFFY
jgi:DNA-binding GntR family transcriptional regulator